MAKKETKEKPIEVTLWEAANKLRGSVEPAEYKYVVLGLIFLKFASDKFENHRAKLIAEGNIKIDVRLEEETLWLNQSQLCVLFQKSKATISEHIKNVFQEGELNENSVVRNFRTTAADGKNYDTFPYNLDVIISVGYRVKSPQGT